MPAPEPIPDLLRAVNSASGKAFALWLTFLSVGTYLAISIGTTTHLQLLLAGPVKLPLLGVDLPLFAFYGFVPPLFVVLHLYVLMQLYLFARLLRLFDDDLRAAGMIEQDRRRVRGQLDKFVFTQSMIGAPEEWIVRLFLGAVVGLSLFVGPALLLAGFWLRFFPYHSFPVSIEQWVTLLLDLVLVGLLAPKIARTSAPQVQTFRGSPWRIAGVSFICICSVGIGVILYVVARPPQDLVLVNERLVEPDEDKLLKLAVTLRLRGRDLRGGDFSGSDFRKADLAGADLRGADLSVANLSGADLTDTKLGSFVSSRLEGTMHLTRLNNADLHDAKNLSQKQLDKACGTDAKLPPGLTLKPCSPPD